MLMCHIVTQEETATGTKESFRHRPTPKYTGRTLSHPNTKTQRHRLSPLRRKSIMKSYYTESHYIEISLVNIRFSGETFSVQWEDL